MTQSPNPITLVTALDHPVFHRGLHQLIAGDTRFQLLAEASTGRELLKLVTLHRPQLVLTSVSLPAVHGIEACRAIRCAFPDTGIIALCLSEEDEEVLQVIRAGASACLLKDSLTTELLPALQTVAEGRLHHNTLMEKALQQLYTYTAMPHEARFTPRELQVINLICRQFTGREIARALSLSHRTVEAIRTRLQQKLGVRSGVGIALYALKKGLIRVD